MPIKLEYGKKYVCRNGAVVGPLEKNPAEGSHYKFKYNGISWSKDGVWSIGCEDGKDIVAEYHEYVWKWMVPDKPGVWAFGGVIKKRPVAVPNDLVVIITNPEIHCEGWYCFLMDIPSIQMPPKQRVTKRLWLRKTEGCIITLKTEEQKAADPFYSFAYQERWEPNEVTPEGWIFTNITKEVEE